MCYVHTIKNNYTYDRKLQVYPKQNYNKMFFKRHLHLYSYNKNYYKIHIIIKNFFIKIEYMSLDIYNKI